MESDKEIINENATDEEIINRLVADAVVSMTENMLKQTCQMHTENMDELFNITNKMILVTVDTLIDKIKEIQMDNMRNMDFIKAVLFTQNLSNNECYANYVNEWNRLNANKFKKVIDPAVDPTVYKSIDAKSHVCDHEKSYTALPIIPAGITLQWKCIKCGKEGLERVNNSESETTDASIKTRVDNN
jgi:hypothetical protein